MVLRGETGETPWGFSPWEKCPIELLGFVFSPFLVHPRLVAGNRNDCDSGKDETFGFFAGHSTDKIQPWFFIRGSPAGPVGAENHPMVTQKVMKNQSNHT